MNYINSTNIYIYASELSNLVGLNKYRKPAEVLLKIWKTNYPQDYQHIKERLEENKIGLALDEKKEETLLCSLAPSGCKERTAHTQSTLPSTTCT